MEYWGACEKPCELEWWLWLKGQVMAVEGAQKAEKPDAVICSDLWKLTLKPSPLAEVLRGWGLWEDSRSGDCQLMTMTSALIGDGR